MQRASFASSRTAVGGSEASRRSVARCVARAPPGRRSRSGLCRATVQDDGEDLYDVLQVSPSDSAEDVRSAYMAKIKQAHPDVAGNSKSATARAALLNQAYDTLSDPVKRGAYERGLTGTSRSATARRAQAGSRPGLVGPLRATRLLTKLVPRRDGAVTALEDVRDSVREFLKTFTFTTELPLPMPVQVDEVPDGCRVAVMTLSGGSTLVQLGDLSFSFRETLDCDIKPSPNPVCDWECVVHRRWPVDGAEGPLPGEARIMSAFMREFEGLLQADGPAKEPWFQLPSWLSFVFAALPVGLGADGPSSGQYRQYNLLRACRLDAKPE